MNQTESQLQSSVLTSVNNAMDVIEICQSFQHRERNLRNNVDVDSTNFLVNAIEGSLVHKLHTDADVWISKEGSIEGHDIS